MFGDQRHRLWIMCSKVLTEYMFSELSQITDIVASASNPRTALDLQGRQWPLPCPLDQPYMMNIGGR
jgi:hypothetical protein